MTASRRQRDAAAPKREAKRTSFAIRNTHCTLFAIFAVLSAYLVYASSFPGPGPGEPAPLWPYACVLLGLAFGGVSISACFDMDEHGYGIGWLLGCDGLLAFVHFWVWLGYHSAYASNEDPHPYPSIWLCYLTLCACANAVFCRLFMPAHRDKSGAKIETLHEHDEEAAMLGAGSS
ncbi:hypothetical protein LTR56_009601 [Elasticomyces elasticus]|nr:hypothetical protein LTR56_009601 [Elasticomyces elasticus]KAK3657279.1 hypothetical protein LTR22_009454 [Elasticomyces elasticus]KAK4922173.1 hypothetical protein LTR49_010393 [Elasticomyces elasticus]KAK5760887.1 hypothetical protein LTS12_009064 [Elasticomyces elasticus]